MIRVRRDTESQSFSLSVNYQLSTKNNKAPIMGIPP